MSSFEIDGRRIGGGHPPYVIAEIGINHNGDVALAEQLLEAAKDAGASAAKLQAFVPAQLLSRSSPYFDLLADCALSRDNVKHLVAAAKSLDITLFSAVFDEESADLLAEVGAPAFKIASGDINHLPLLRHVAAFGRPMLVSSGAATLDECIAALNAIRSVSPSIPVAFFHCVSNYPTEPADANLAAMTVMREALGVPVGFSDHTMGNAVPIAATALGAELLEKHFTLDRNDDGPDHKLSAEPADMAALVRDVAVAYAAIGQACKAPVETPELIRAIRRSVTAQVAIPAGARIEREMLAIKRPGNGIQPDDIERVIGCTPARGIEADTTLQWADLDTGGGG